MTTKLTATQRAQEASWQKYGNNHDYMRMIEAYAFAVRLEALLREALPFIVDAGPNGDITARIKELLDGGAA